MTFMILLIESENITNISSQELRFLYYIAVSYKQPNLIIINHQHLLCKQMIYLHSRGEMVHSLLTSLSRNGLTCPTITAF